MSLIERSFRERIVLVGVQSWPRGLSEIEESLDELASLVNTAGADEVARVIQSKNVLDPATLIGTGKAEELHLLCEQVDADTVVFDEDLTPAQHRNLEKILGRTAIDRTAVILDIFAQNARTEEGCAQVELAILKYRLPRLRGRGVALSRQSAGIGTRGPGETKLESDRRRITRRIAGLERQLKALEVKRGVQRKSRERSQVPSIALVGYTNAGKSTLLNALTEANALVQDRLFSTLDSKTKKLILSNGEEIICSDTVGFVKKLPHQLVESFRSTLEEVRTADLLLHVVDSHANAPEAQMEAVRQVLHEVNADEVEELIVFNKADLDSTQATRLCNLYPGSVVVSAAMKENIGELIRIISERIHATDKCINLRIPYARGDLLDLLHKKAQIISENNCETSVELKVKIREQFMAKLSPFTVTDDSYGNEHLVIDNLLQ
jgi:GTP-binding protein HflX